MKIGIVTIYKGFNCGAYLQAYALYEFLAQQGHQVKFVKHTARKPFWEIVKSVSKRILLFQFQEIPFWIRFYSQLRKLQSRLETCSVNEAEEFDLIIYGSDEIWNIKKKSNCSNPILFGKYIHNKNKIAYAAALNGAVGCDFKQNEEIYSLIKPFVGLSARDKASQSTLADVFGVPAALVVDPTLLLDKQFYVKKAVEVDLPPRFILLYLYKKSLTDEGIVKKILDFSRENGIPLVSICNPLSWCDISIGLSPYEMLYAFHNASYVITNTFHGIMFSLIFEKNMVISGVHNTKVDEAVKFFCCQSRVIKENDVGLNNIVDSDPDFDGIKQAIETERMKSIAYLKKYIR